MAYTLEKVPGLPVILYIQGAEPDSQQSIGGTLESIARLLDEQTEKTFVVWSIQGVKINVDELVEAASKGGRGSDAVLHHPNLRENIYVVSGSLLRMAVKGLESATFGHVQLKVVDSVEEALSYCRANL